MIWDRLEDIRTHLDNTIIRLKDGTPVIVTSVYNRDDGGFRVSSCDLRDTSKSYDNLPLEEYDISPVPLGYVNILSSSTSSPIKYLMRSPRRRWKHGLDSGNLMFLEGNSHRRIDFMRFNKDLVATINGEYPSFLEAMKMPQGGAFTRDLRVTSDGAIYYKEKLVAAYSEGSLITLGRYKFLQKRLEKYSEN